MKITFKLFFICVVVALVLILLKNSNIDNLTSDSLLNSQEVVADQNQINTKYINLSVPNINSSFKPYMDYRTITDKNSDQYKFIQKWGWSDYEGFMRCDGERNLGIEDNYYLIALGSYYGTKIGTKYRLTLNTGRVFYGVLADCKADKHTNSTNQYGRNKDVVEFLVDTRRLNKSVRYHGTANVYMPLNGSVVKVEKIEFK